jgi:hypothetical protein
MIEDRPSSAVAARPGRRSVSRAGRATEITIEIERLVLEGFASIDESAVEEAMRAELSRLLTGPDRAPIGPTSTTDRMRAEIALRPSARASPATVLGMGIAGAVDASIRPRASR